MKKVFYICMIIVFIMVSTSCGNEKVQNGIGKIQIHNQDNEGISKDEVSDPSIIHQHEWDQESLKKEMVETIQWVFENWQTFDYQTYEPTKYGLAFSLNFRLRYIFDNYDGNVETVKHHQIVSQVKVQEIKDVGLAFNEEDHTLYGQVRIMTRYHQKIDGKEYQEPVEVLIFSKRHEDSNEGWEITNVDMYPTVESSGDFTHLFFGFKKPS